METLYTIEQFNEAKSTDKLPIQCTVCDKVFLKLKRVITRKKYKNSNNYIGLFCSSKCSTMHLVKKQEVQCEQCDTLFVKPLFEIKRTKHNFCSSSCACIYNNAHKTTGIRRSKLEIRLEQKLTLLYPSLEILYCDRTAIKSELDIYIPSLNLAFELNGIFHYEPIFGQGKLDQVQNNDNRKFQACLENNIELCIIDVSSLNYFKEQKCIKYLDIIANIIDTKLNLVN